MTKNIIFIQLQGNPDIVEAEIPERPTLDDLEVALTKAGIELHELTGIFIDEGDAHSRTDRMALLKDFKHGCRIHLTHCHKIKTEVHYLESTVKREFTPGTRLRTVKAWVVRDLRIDDKDAGEHVLRLCNSTREPPTDTPLAELADQHQCSVCFDFVPVKRVEG